MLEQPDVVLFQYPETLHVRRHGPSGYQNYVDKMSGLYCDSGWRAVLLLIFGQQVTHAQAPSLSHADVPALLKRRLTQEFVPDQVIVKMKPVAGTARALGVQTLFHLPHDADYSRWTRCSRGLGRGETAQCQTRCRIRPVRLSAQASTPASGAGSLIPTLCRASPVV